MSTLFATDDLGFLWQSHAPVYLIASLIVLYVGKIVFQKTISYDLNNQLTEVDNKAVALVFSGYFFGLIWVLLGVFQSDEVHSNLYLDVLNTIVWGIIGIFLLNISRMINDKMVLTTFSTHKELIEDKNAGTGAVQFGSIVATSLIIHSVLAGDPVDWITDITAMVIYFAAGQIAFILYSMVYKKLTTYDIHSEIEQDNEAAGIVFGTNLIAIGILTSGYIKGHESLIGLALWIFVCIIVLSANRFLVDKFILPGSKLDDEVVRDRNWGAALIEGLGSIGIALLMVKLFL